MQTPLFPLQVRYSEADVKFIEIHYTWPEKEYYIKPDWLLSVFGIKRKSITPLKELINVLQESGEIELLDNLKNNGIIY